MSTRSRETLIPVGPVVAAIGAIMLIVSLFLDWYEGPPGDGISGFTVFEFLDLLLTGLAVVMLVSLADAGAGRRSISLPFTWTTSWISSRSSSAGSACGHGSSQTRSPVIISYTSAPRCGANGKISEPAVATAKRTSPGAAESRCR